MARVAAFVPGFIGYVCINMNSWEKELERSLRMAWTGGGWQFTALELCLCVCDRERESPSALDDL